MRGLTGKSAVSLLERDAELGELSAALTEASEGDGALVVIEGPAGIGKTRLVRAAERQAANSGLAVGSARGTELERELAFGGVRQALEPLLAEAGPDGRSRLFGDRARLAEPVFTLAAGAEREGGAGVDPEFSILHGLYWLCVNLAQERPLLLAVDDGHWLDLASLRFLAYLAQRFQGLPIAILVATRPVPEGGAAGELVQRMQAGPEAVVLRPEPLTAGALQKMVAEALGRSPHPEFAAACLRATGGVPLLVRELIQSLKERSVEPEAASASQVQEIGPPAVARYVIARVRALAPGAEAFANAVAVLGPDAMFHRVAGLAGIEPDAAASAADSLVLAGVIETGTPLDFVHPVVRAAVYDGIPPSERSGLHRQAAAMLTKEGESEDRVAGHLLSAEPTGDIRAVDLLLRTARRAAARGAPQSAIAYLRRALAEPPRDPGTRCQIVRELGAAEAHSGELAEGRRHLEEAYLLAEPGRHRALVAQELAGCLRLQWDHGEAAAVIAAALEQLDPADVDLAQSLRAELILMAALEPTTHRADIHHRDREDDVAEAGLGTAKLDAALAADGALRMTASAADVRGHVAAAREHGIVDDLVHGGSLWINAVAPLIMAGGFDLAERMVDEALDAGQGRASVVFSARALLTRSFLRQRQGALADAQADAEAALEALGEAGYYFALLAVFILVEAGCERGELEQAESVLERFGMLGEIPDTFIHNWSLGSRGRLRLEQGRVEAATADLEELIARNDRRGQRNPAELHARSRLATALFGVGDANRARGLAEEEVGLATSWGEARAVGVSLRALGLCLGGDEGIARLRDSADALDGSGARLEHAHTLVALGAALRRSGARADAREPLQSGMELAHACGAVPLVERAREELRATGARPRRIMRTGVDALTPSELRVARLAADGLTNREIAQALFVTQRTVEGHLTHVFQKLDISSRGELPERLTAEATTSPR